MVGFYQTWQESSSGAGIQRCSYGTGGHHGGPGGGPQGPKLCKFQTSPDQLK